MTVRACSPRGSEWLAEYRLYAVELHRRFEAGIISIAEVASSNLVFRSNEAT